MSPVSVDDAVRALPITQANVHIAGLARADNPTGVEEQLAYFTARREEIRLLRAADGLSTLTIDEFARDPELAWDLRRWFIADIAYRVLRLRQAFIITGALTDVATEHTTLTVTDIAPDMAHVSEHFTLALDAIIKLAAFVLPYRLLDPVHDVLTYVEEHGVLPSGPSNLLALPRDPGA